MPPRDIAYPMPTSRQPYAYPMPTLRVQAGGAPLLQHDAQRAARQHGHVRLSTVHGYVHV